MTGAILFTVLFLVAIGLLFMAYRQHVSESGRTTAEQRMIGALEEDISLHEEVPANDERAAKKRSSLVTRIVERLSGRLQDADTMQGQEGQSLLTWVDRQLILAGMRDQYTPYQALSTMLVIWVFGVVAFVLTWQAGLPIFIAIALLGAMLAYPPMKVRQQQQERKDLMESELAFFIMELVMACNNGRSSLDDALLRVATSNAARPNGVLGREFELACTEYRVGGRNREEALLDVTHRTGNEGVEALVDAINAANITGADPMHILREQSDQARRLRKQSLRTFAGRQKPKGTLGLVGTMGGGLAILATPMVLSVFDLLGGF